MKITNLLSFILLIPFLWLVQPKVSIDTPEVNEHDIDSTEILLRSFVAKVKLSEAELLQLTINKSIDSLNRDTVIYATGTPTYIVGQ